MDNAHNSMMPEACTAQVFHLQYFLSRDFRYDLFVCINFMVVHLGDDFYYCLCSCMYYLSHVQS